MSPLRWDVLLVGFVLALPVLALGLRGDLSTEEMIDPPAVVPGRRLGRRRAAPLRQHAPAPTGAPAKPARRPRQPLEPADGRRALTDRLSSGPPRSRGVVRAPGVLQDPEARSNTPKAVVHRAARLSTDPRRSSDRAAARGSVAGMTDAEDP